MTDLPVKTISPAEAHRLINAGASLIDIREPDEHRRERIAGAFNLPLARVAPEAAAGDTLIFHCRSGMRTALATEQLAGAANGRDCYVLESGIEGWRGAGFPTTKTTGAPIEMQRQVMIAAGALVLAGTLLSLLFARGLIVLPLFVGAGLMVAGITGFCGMARLLALAPWNRRVTALHG